MSFWSHFRRSSKGGSHPRQLFKSTHKASIAKKVIKAVHRFGARHRSVAKAVIKAVHRLSWARREKLRTFGVPRAGTHVHKAKKIKMSRAARSHRTFAKPRKPKH